MSRISNRWIGLGAAGLTLGALGIGYGTHQLVWNPPERMEVSISCEESAPAVPDDQPLKVMVWNIQYGASRQHHFFYDGGKAVRVPLEHVTTTLDQVAAVIAREDPDLVLLQEVDRGSDRTGRVDQHAELLARLASAGSAPYPCHLSTPYHRAGWVPHPSYEHLGRVDMNLSVFSRYRIDHAVRHQLALLDEPWWRRAFNLKRALLEVHLPTAGGQTLVAFNTHLSAFSRGDGTLAKQMAQLDEHMRTAQDAGHRWLLAGDLNALPPGDDPSRLGQDAELYAEKRTPVQPLFDHHTSLIPAQSYLDEPERWRTYLPFGAPSPDRTLDYVFLGEGVRGEDPQVLPETTISDHLPIVFTLILPDEDAA